MRKVEFEVCDLRDDFVESSRYPSRYEADQNRRITVERVPVHSVSVRITDGLSLDFRIAVCEPVHADPESPIRVRISSLEVHARLFERQHREALLYRIAEAQDTARRAEAHAATLRRRLVQEEADRIARDEARAYRESWGDRYLLDR